MFATLCVVLVVLFLYKNMKKKAKARNMETTDFNPIYGQYYFPEGIKIDESNVEVEDQNDAYEEQYEELVEWFKRDNKLFIFNPTISIIIVIVLILVVASPAFETDGGNRDGWLFGNCNTHFEP